MTDHPSLDDFAEQADDSEDDEAAMADADAVDDTEAVDDDVDVVDDDEAVGEKDDAGGDDEVTVGERVAAAAPATATSRFDPDGVACGACDAEVVRLWVADDEPVCVDCKSW